MTSSSPPLAYPRLQRVGSFEELLATPLADGVNALCWERTLTGDYREVVTLLGRSEENITTLDEARLRGLPLSAGGRIAVEQMLSDQRRLREHGLAPELNCIQSYPREEEPGAVPIDVYSFHADSATVAADTWLCTYHGPPSEGLRNEDARRHVDIPETRAALLKHFGGEDGDDFRAYLNENCYDLHYAPRPDAQPFSFGVGNLWRIAVAFPGNPVPPCIHRAPATVPGQPPRLLLIS